MTDPSSGAHDAVDTVVRAFTEAELALSDIAGAIERFRSASEQLTEARDSQAAANTALAASTDATTAVAGQVGALVEHLGEAAGALRAIEPERLWKHLEQSEADRIAEGTAVQARIDGLTRSARKAVRVSIISTVASFVAVILLVALTLRGL